MSEVLLVIAVVLVCIVLLLPAIYTACATGQLQCMLQMAQLLI